MPFRFLLALASCVLINANGDNSPTVHDSRLSLSLFAEAPEIVTPIGLAIAPDDGIFVIESHTHLPPNDYPGPKGDRVRLFKDSNRDGLPEINQIFAEGLEAAMNLTITSEGRIFVVGARTVWELIDGNNDGKAETRRVIAEVKTKNTYPHSCLLGITHSFDGWLYLGRGNNGSVAYSVIGSDGSSVSGYGDGGNVLRCRFDGSLMEEFATGFWNLFDLEFDQDGRLLGVDNDPDARGPNRLVHIVQHGDYGYKSIYGGGGNHAYHSWNGELPGTLPFVSGTGEAPSGLIDARRTNLPTDYQDSRLVTVWNEHSIEQHHTSRWGNSITATNSILVSGPQNFRPVAIDADSHGTIFITDWVDVAYPNHGKGRIWRLETEKRHRTAPSPYDAKKSSRKNGQNLALEKLKTIKSARSERTITAALLSNDPFTSHAAVLALSEPKLSRLRNKYIKNSEVKLRLGALLAQKMSAPRNSESQILAFLKDPSPRIRQSALQWIGEFGLSQFNEQLSITIRQKPTPPELFETYLATIAITSDTFSQALKKKNYNKASQIPRPENTAVIVAAIKDPSLSEEVRSLAVTHYPHHTTENALPFLREVLNTTPTLVQLQVIRSLAEIDSEQIPQIVTSIALDKNQATPLRREALLALERLPIIDFTPLIELTRSENIEIVLSSIRLLALHVSVPAVKSAINRCYVIHRNRPNSDALIEQLEDILYSEPGCCQPRVTYRPQTTEEWQFALRSGGDPILGETVFRSIRSGCAQCHAINNRGGNLGPNLSNAGQSVDRKQLIQSILRPSEQFPPQYQAWVIETRDGEEHRGLQLDHKANGAIEMFTLLGRTERFSKEEIDRYYAAPKSLMPDGLETGLSTSEMRDLIAYLESLR